MTTYFTGDRTSAYGTWQGPGPNSSPSQPTGQATRMFDDFTNIPPDSRWDRSIRMKRFQNDVSQWIPGDAGSLSRAQAQGPGVHPMNVLRWTEFWMKLNSLATLNSDDFHMCWEIHTPSANPGGVTTLNLRTGPQQSMFRQWVGPGSFTHAYRGRASIAFGEWHHYIIGFKPSTSGAGEFYCYRDGVLQYSQTGYNSTTQSGTHYPEIGFYTYWSAQGTDDMNIAGLVVTDTQPSYPGGGGGSGATPTVSITNPTSGGVFIGTLPYTVDITSAPSGALLYVGLASSGLNAPDPFPAPVSAGDSTISNSIDLSLASSSGNTNQTLYAALHNSAGTQIANATIAGNTVYPAAQTTPVEGVVDVSSDTSVTIRGDLADPDVVIPLDEVEWAEYDLPKTYQVRRARERATGRWLKYDSGAGGYIFDPDASSIFD